MTKELKEKWIEALRSGAYTQGRMRLKLCSSKGPSYCCLGVLCDLIDPNGWTYGEDISGKVSCEGWKHGETELFPNTVPDKNFFREWTYDEEFLSIFHGMPVEELVEMNDQLNVWEDEEKSSLRTHTFDEIADYIETNVATHEEPVT